MKTDQPREGARKADVVLNIFGRPFQTALSVLSLNRHCRPHIGKVWFQFEPVAAKCDQVPPLAIVNYLADVLGIQCGVSQPEEWLATNPPDPARLDDENYRHSIRCQFAFEKSQAKYLFLTHNDIYVFADILGALLENIGAAFAIGQKGQCWNCPAAKEELMAEVMGCGACSPERQDEIKPTAGQLERLYALAKERGLYRRLYDVGPGSEFAEKPWPLPECRINEWACLLNLELARKAGAPFGPGLPPGAFKMCGLTKLDTGVAWFREMYALGYRAKHFDISKYMKHWVGTGNKTPAKYAFTEDRALRLLREHFPEYLEWLAIHTGQDYQLKNDQIKTE